MSISLCFCSIRENFLALGEVADLPACRQVGEHLPKPDQKALNLT
jgi:hypothetical protein